MEYASFPWPPLVAALSSIILCLIYTFYEAFVSCLHVFRVPKEITEH